MARELAAMPAVGEQRLRMTFDEFVAWTDEDTHAEWVGGEVIVFMPSSWTHQGFAYFLASLLGLYVRLFRLGEVRFAPFQMRLAPSRSAREPDLLFVATKHLDRVREQWLEGPADLVIEIVSADSVTRDQRDKLAEYQAGGVLEYWWFDSRPGHREFRFFRLTDAGRYVETPPDAAGRYHSNVLPGFWFDPTWLWHDPLPDPLTLLELIAPDAIQVTRGVSGAGASPDEGDR